MLKCWHTHPPYLTIMLINLHKAKPKQSILWSLCGPIGTACEPVCWYWHIVLWRKNQHVGLSNISPYVISVPYHKESPHPTPPIGMHDFTIAFFLHIIKHCTWRDLWVWKLAWHCVHGWLCFFICSVRYALPGNDLSHFVHLASTDPPCLPCLDWICVIIFCLDARVVWQISHSNIFLLSSVSFSVKYFLVSFWSESGDSKILSSASEYSA